MLIVGIFIIFSFVVIERRDLLLGYLERSKKEWLLR